MVKTAKKCYNELMPEGIPKPDETPAISPNVQQGRHALAQMHEIQKGIADTLNIPSLAKTLSLKPHVEHYKKTGKLDETEKVARNTVAVVLTEHMWKNLDAWLKDHESFATADMFMDEQYLEKAPTGTTELSPFKSRKHIQLCIEEKIQAGKMQTPEQLETFVGTLLRETFSSVAGKWFSMEQAQLMKEVSSMGNADEKERISTLAKNGNHSPLEQHLLNHALYFDGKQNALFPDKIDAAAKLKQSGQAITQGLETGIRMTMKIFSGMKEPSVHGMGFLSSIAKNTHLSAFPSVTGQPIEVHNKNRVHLAETADQDTAEIISASVRKRAEQQSSPRDIQSEPWITGCPAFFAEGTDPKKNVMQELYEWLSTFCTDISYWELKKQLEMKE